MHLHCRPQPQPVGGSARARTLNLFFSLLFFYACVCDARVDGRREGKSGSTFFLRCRGFAARPRLDFPPDGGARPRGLPAQQRQTQPSLSSLWFVVQPAEPHFSYQHIHTQTRTDGRTVCSTRAAMLADHNARRERSRRASACRRHHGTGSKMPLRVCLCVCPLPASPQL